MPGLSSQTPASTVSLATTVGHASGTPFPMAARSRLAVTASPSTPSSPTRPHRRASASAALRNPNQITYRFDLEPGGWTTIGMGPAHWTPAGRCSASSAGSARTHQQPALWHAAPARRRLTRRHRLLRRARETRRRPVSPRRGLRTPWRERLLPLRHLEGGVTVRSRALEETAAGPESGRRWTARSPQARDLLQSEKGSSPWSMISRERRATRRSSTELRTKGAAKVDELEATKTGSVSYRAREPLPGVPRGPVHPERARPGPGRPRS